MQPTAHDHPGSPSGREREISRLTHELREVQRLGAAPRVCLVRGPTGIGRTFLLSAFRREAAAQGARVLESAAPRVARPAHGLFSDLVTEALGVLSETGVPDRELLELGRRVAPITGRGLRPVPGDQTPRERRLDLFEAVVEIFSLAGRHAPPVVLLDDVDAADEGSLELLRYVLASLTTEAAMVGGSGTRSLWVVSFRDDHDLPPVLADVVARVPATAVPLAGLDLDGLRAFLARSALVERLLDSTGGVPERIEALLSVEAPAGVADLLQRRLALLPTLERAALEALAATARPVEAAFLGQVVSRLGEAADHPDLEAALERLVADRQVSGRFGARAALFDLARPSDRERLLAGLPRPRRAQVHGAVAAVLVAAGDPDPVEVARHLRIADPAGEGVVWSVRAGERLTERLAFAEAAEAYEQALAAMPERFGPLATDLYQRLVALHRGMADHVTAMRWLGLLRRASGPEPGAVRAARATAARISLTMGRPRTAERLARTVLAGARAPSITDAVSVGAFADLAEAAWAQGRYEDAVGFASTALHTIEEGGNAPAEAPELGAEALQLRNTLGKVRLHQGDYDAAQVLFERNAAQAQALGQPRERARAHNNLGVVAQRRGDRRAALEHYRASLDLRQGAGDRGREAFALQNIAALYHETGEFEPALDHYQRALAGFTRARNAAQVARTAGNLANLYVFLGDLDRADALSEHALAVSAEVSDPYLEGYAHAIRGDLLRLRGARAEARRAYREALTRFTGIASPRYALETRISLASLLADEGDLRGAGEILGEVEAELSDHAFPGLAVLQALAAAEVGLLLGQLDRVAQHLGRARDLLLETPDLESPVRLYHLLARLRDALGDPDGAEVHAARAQRLQDELAARVPPSHRPLFLAVPRRRAVQTAVAPREITSERIRRALSLDAPRTPEPHPFPEIVGRHPRLLKVLSLIDRVATVDTPVLIRGESGTGKELIADAIHRRSRRSDGPFVKVNCAAMHEELLLSELFGHEKGAFTGAVKERKGRFELADGGTLFLDEIGDISAGVQVALLRVLQSKEFQRVGGSRTLTTNVRVVCATHRNLEDMISEGAFREDLYYRLKGIVLELPSLRQRASDLPALVEHFLHTIATERGEPARTLSPEVLSILSSHPWPGNVRELENVLQNLTLFAAGSVIGLQDLEHLPEIRAAAAPRPEEAAAPTPGAAGLGFYEMARTTGLSLKDLKTRVESECIRSALSEADGNISEAARLLGMKRSRLSQIVNGDDDLRSLAKGR